MKPITSTAMPTASQPARQPLRSIAACAISGRHDQPRHLRQRGDRDGEGAPGDEPVVDRAVDAEVEGAGEVRPRHAEQQIEHRKRAGERQQHVRQRRSSAPRGTARHGRR